MRFLITLSLLLLITAAPASAQKILQMEKYGSYKTKRYYIGDEITFMLKGEKGNWRNDVITDLNLEQNLVYFSNGVVKLDEIIALRPNYLKETAWAWSSKLYWFGTGWAFWSVAAIFIGQPLTWSVAIVSGSAFATGWIIGQIIKCKKYKIKNKRRLRILDLTMYPATIKA